MQQIEIYTKNGDAIKVSKDLAEQFIKNGFFRENPTKKQSKTKKEISNG